MLHSLEVMRRASSLGLLGLLLALASGCGEQTGPPPAEVVTKQQDDQAARKAAYGKSGVPVGKVKTPDQAK
jgi:hypothetical protein